MPGPSRGFVQVHCRSSWMRSAVQELTGRMELPQTVTLLLDYPTGSALELLPLLEPPVVVATASESPYYLQDLIEHAPAALLTEPLEAAQLEAALRLAAQGQTLSLPTIPSDQRLTPRERQVLRLLTRGWSDKEIAQALCIEPKTVSHWVLSLRQKMGAENRAQAILHYWGNPPAIS